MIRKHTLADIESGESYAVVRLACQPVGLSPGVCMNTGILSSSLSVLTGCKVWFFCLFLILPHMSYAANLYVDQQIGAASCTNYSASTRSCGAGSETAYSNIAGAAAVAGPGDIVNIRAGTYNEALTPGNSGAQGNQLVYRNHNLESVVLTGSLRPAINLTNRQHIVVEGLDVNNVLRWVSLDNAQNNILKNNTFRLATDASGGGKTGIFLNNATFNKIINNTIDDNAADSITIVNSDRNLIEGNTFTKAGHALWAIRCGNFNVIRGNYFHNAIQKDGEVYDCDNTAGHTQFNATKRNLIEGNEFAFTPSSGNASPFSGIQYAGQDGILRNNTFHDTIGPGLRMAIYGAEAQYNTGNRIYHNVFYGTDYAGVFIEQGGNFSNNSFKNNIFMKSIFVANDTRWSWWVNTVAGKPVQVMTARLDGFEFDTNAFFNTQAGEAWLMTYGWRTPGWNQQYDMTYWENNYPQLVRNSIEQDAAFVDEAGRDFHLSATSPMIDAGTFLTNTVSSGSGTVIAVEDASYFYDGFGIPGESGDEIRISGQSTSARIISIDYTANTITLDRSMNWSNGQGVSLKYNGSAPDLGAFETGATQQLAPPMPPTIIDIEVL